MTLNPETIVTEPVLHGKLDRQFEVQTPEDDNKNVKVMKDFIKHATSMPQRTESYA